LQIFQKYSTTIFIISSVCKNHLHMDAHDDISKAQKIRNFLIVLSRVAIPCSQPMNEDTRQKKLFLRSITKVYHQWKHIIEKKIPRTSLERERKEGKIRTKQTSFFTLIASNLNSQSNFKSFSIKFSTRCGKTISWMM
jgi:hypothetical protein